MDALKIVWLRVGLRERCDNLVRLWEISFMIKITCVEGSLGSASWSWIGNLTKRSKWLKRRIMSTMIMVKMMELMGRNKFMVLLIFCAKSGGCREYRLAYDSPD